MSGDRHLATENVPPGLTVNYYLREPLAQTTQVMIYDALGQEVAKLEGESKAGVNQVHWDSSATDEVQPGIYRITLSAGENSATTHAKLLAPQAFSVGQTTLDASANSPQ
jgi:flagellar hook assembly protein FlgD